MSGSFGDDDDGLFDFMNEMPDLLEVAAVVADTRDGEPELRFYPRGLGSLDCCEPVRLVGTEISIENIRDRLDALHRNQLVTPGAQAKAMKLWKNARQGLVQSNAEDRLSALVEAGLQTAFPNCRVRAEQPQSTGRLDIEIEEPVPLSEGTIERHAVLELKVLRGKHPNGRNVSARKTKETVADGIDQAAAYRNERGARLAALVCYDMRLEYTGESCFSHVATKAAGVNVSLLVWHLFSSSKKYRQHLASN